MSTSPKKPMLFRHANVVVKEPEPQAPPKPVVPSPHVVDLLRHAEQQRNAERIASIGDGDIQVMPRIPRSFFGRVGHFLDDRIHLHDTRQRTVSVQPHARKQFPHVHATGMRHAVAIATNRFLDEHPLAELTVLRTLHLTALTSWHIVSWPHRAVRGEQEEILLDTFPEADGTESVRGGIPAVMPFFAATVTAPVAPAPHPAATPMAAIKQALAPAPEPIIDYAEAPSRWFRPIEFRFAFAPNWRRTVTGFAVVAAMLVVPAGVYSSYNALFGSTDSVMANGSAAIGQLRTAADAAKNRDFVSAGAAFGDARDGFARAKEKLGALAQVLEAANVLFPRTQVAAAAPLLNVGREVADGGEKLAAGFAAMERAQDPTAKVAAIKDSLLAALPHVEFASREITRVPTAALPAAYREYVTTAQQELPRVAAALKKAGDVAEIAVPLLGNDRAKRYLVIFQNNAELRPTGGFMGSFALIDVEKGKVTNMEIPGGGTYDLKGQLTAKLRSPQPLRLINARWQFQDSNWYPDFASSAQQINWFYEKAGGPTTDGVIAINATLMEQLLAITGPIEMPEYGKTISAQNFYFETQKAVEVEYDKEENKPKQFIADLAPKVLEKLTTGDQGSFLALAATLDDALAKKDIQLWMKDGDVQEKLGALGWTGAMKPTDGDYLALVHTNIAGQKTDLVMKDDVQHAVKVLPDGTGIVTLTVSRTHTGSKGAMFNGVRNVDYLRVYVPAGSTLVEAKGFSQPDPKLFKLADLNYEDDAAIAMQDAAAKIDRDSGTRTFEEHGKTVFANWLQTDPGQTSVATLVYQLPAGTIPLTRAATEGVDALYDKLQGGGRDALKYTLLVQKQSGANPMRFTSSVDLPRGFTPTWQEPLRSRDDRQRWVVTADIDRDAFLGAIAESP